MSGRPVPAASGFTARRHVRMSRATGLGERRLRSGPIRARRGHWLGPRMRVVLDGLRGEDHVSEIGAGFCEGVRVGVACCVPGP